MPLGGCPVLNIGIDANNQNPELAQRVQYIIQRLIDQMAQIIEAGIRQGEFNASVDAHEMSRRIYSMIEGSLFTASLMHREQHLLEMMDFIDHMIDKDLLT